MSQDKANNTERLEKMLGFDPGKRHSLPGDIFQEVVKEIQDERAKEVRLKAKEQLLRAMQIKQEMDQAQKKFDSEIVKFNKELGKIMNQIQNMLSGKPSDENVSEELIQPSQA